jgi:hypothetical protein
VPAMIRIVLKSVLLVVACHCLFARCAEASIIGSASDLTGWDLAPSYSGLSEAVPSDEERGRANLRDTAFSSIVLQEGANSSSGTSSPTSPSSSVSPSASLASGFDLQHPQLEARLFIGSSLSFPNPPPSSLLEPPRLAFV